jgi:hypothetical protein
MLAIREFIWNLPILLGTVLFCNSALFLAQVSPIEIRSPQLKTLEQTYFEELKSLNQDIQNLKFAFPVIISRFVGLDPQAQHGTDTRGLEFVRFHERTVLKVSANYNAAFNAAKLSQNQRADQVVSDVIEPILQLMPKYFTGKSGFDAIGFEIAYHVRTASKKYDYEGREILALVFSREDALRFSTSVEEVQKQEILNNSEIFMDGKEFNLARGGRDPLTFKEMEKKEATSKVHSQGGNFSAPETRINAVLRTNEPSPIPGIQSSGKQPDLHMPEPLVLEKRSPSTASESKSTPGPTQAELDKIQAKYQTQLDSLAKEGESRFHFVNYAPPSFISFRERIYLQLTVRNPNSFDKDQTSIYRRSARTFDLFLAPMLKDIISKVPSAQEFAGLDVTVLTQFAPNNSSSSEAIEFVCPYPALVQFIAYQITNQDFIDESVVLVNGVRIALNLQQVE